MPGQITPKNGQPFDYRQGWHFNNRIPHYRFFLVVGEISRAMEAQGAPAKRCAARTGGNRPHCALAHHRRFMVEYEAIRRTYRLPVQANPPEPETASCKRCSAISLCKSCRDCIILKSRSFSEYSSICASLFLLLCQALFCKVHCVLPITRLGSGLWHHNRALVLFPTALV